LRLEGDESELLLEDGGELEEDSLEANARTGVGAGELDAAGAGALAEGELLDELDDALEGLASLRGDELLLDETGLAGSLEESELFDSPFAGGVATSDMPGALRAMGRKPALPRSGMGCRRLATSSLVRMAPCSALVSGRSGS